MILGYRAATKLQQIRHTAICCSLYSDAWRDDRMKPTDLVHLGYALAYEVDYFITSDRVLNEYRISEEFKLKVLTPEEAIKQFQ